MDGDAGACVEWEFHATIVGSRGIAHFDEEKRVGRSGIVARIAGRIPAQKRDSRLRLREL
jgi:hypothetical protein